VGRRARGLALLGAAAACAGLAASSVSRYTNDVRAQMGPLVPVVRARTDLALGTALTGEAGTQSLEVRRVPVRYAPARALASVSDAIGSRVAVDLARGDYVTRSSLASGGKGASQDDEGGRAVEVEVAGARSLASSLQPGSHVDVLITTDRSGSPGRTYLALQDAELVAFSPSSGDRGVVGGGRATAALRVSLRQAVLLTAAQNFARELRLVPRPGGDRRRIGAVGVSSSGFGG
jgi:pilus assembly protein CpaB